MKKIYFAFMATMALALAACNPNPTNPNALTEKVDPTTEDYTRNVLIEQFTAQSCGACPTGAQAIKMVIEGNESRVVWVAHHAGYAEDKFTIAASKSIAGHFDVNSAPLMMLDRVTQKYNDYGFNTQTGELVIGSPMSSLTFNPVYFQEGGISTMFKDALAKEGEASVHINKEMVDGKLRIGVYGAAKGVTKVRLNVLVVESGLIAEQYGPLEAHGTEYDWLPSYEHNNVPRAYLSPALGDEIILDGGTYQKEYELTLDPTWKLNNCNIVAFLTKSNYKTVLNVASVPVQ